jgi:hypothetical protein
MSCEEGSAKRGTAPLASGSSKLRHLPAPASCPALRMRIEIGIDNNNIFEQHPYEIN